MEVDYLARIPNNVDLADNPRLLRALGQWQPKFLDWWGDMGPAGFQTQDIYLRTAVAVGAKGWAHFDYVKMPDYRWGIFLAEPEAERKVPFGDHKGAPAWQEVPGEHRGMLRRMIVTQGDTEPASVEQQRFLGQTAPSLYDLRNLFQVNVEEGRHLWAMVYLLDAYFGRDGREEAEQLLQRRSGDSDRPRILSAFNEKTPDWLSFYMFTFFTDRAGKFHLAGLAESGFDPLARTCRFMLTEEAHHMFVGDTGIARVVRRTAELMKQHDTDRVGPYGGIDLDLVQRYLNFHFSVSLDLFGTEISTNAASAYTLGIKGRYKEEEIEDDHKLQDATYAVTEFVDGAIQKRPAPALVALNERLQDYYIADCGNGVRRWNKVLQDAGIDFAFKLPHRGFHRRIGTFAEAPITPDGQVVSAEEWMRRQNEWLPSDADRAFVISLMKPETEPGKFAGWVSAPIRGINGQAIEFPYMRETRAE